MSSTCEPEDEFVPRWDWLHFYVEHVKPEWVRLDFDYIPVVQFRWTHHPDDPSLNGAQLLTPMENGACLLTLVKPDDCHTCLVNMKPNSYNSEAMALRPKDGYLLVEKAGPDQWIQEVTSPGELLMWCRQLGRMEIRYSS